MNDKILGILQTAFGGILFLILVISIAIGKITINHTIVITAIILSLANMLYGIYLIIINKNKKEETK